MDQETIGYDIEEILIQGLPVRRLHLTGHYFYDRNHLSPYAVAEYITNTLNNHPTLGPGSRWVVNSMTAGLPKELQSFYKSKTQRTVIDYNPTDQSLTFVTQFDPCRVSEY